jgi:hypothetical protein
MMLSSITKTRYILILASCLFGCSGAKQLSGNNADKGWKTLFNGKDVNDWTVKINHHETGENFGNTFRVEDGIIKIRYDQYGKFNDQFGHLYYKTPFLTSIYVSSIVLLVNSKKAHPAIPCLTAG